MDQNVRHTLLRSGCCAEKGGMPGGPLLDKDNQVSGGRERLVVVHYRELTGGQLRELKAFDPKCRLYTRRQFVLGEADRGFRNKGAELRSAG